MRCLYKIWSQKEFVFQYESGGPTHVLGKLLQTGLRNLAKFELKRLEQDVFAYLEKCLVNPKSKDALQDDEQMAVWAAVLQLILMYYDLFGKTVSVSNMPPSEYPDCTIKRAPRLTAYRPRILPKRPPAAKHLQATVLCLGGHLRSVIWQEGTRLQSWFA